MTIAIALVAGCALAVTGCENPLDVDNPNRLVEPENPSATDVPAAVNGSLATTARAVNATRATYSTATDEITWIGSRDAWNQLDQGGLDNPLNEFADEAYTWVPTARFMARRAVTLGEQFESELTDLTLLPRAYLYAGIIFTTIGDVYDDFAFSPAPDQPTAPVGEDNMIIAYDSALVFLDKGVTTVRDAQTADPDAEALVELEARLLAMRARAHHARAMWQMLNPAGSVPADPLVGNAQAAADAQAALDIVGETSDWTHEFEYTSSTLLFSVEFTNLAFQVNEREELQIGSSYVSTDPADDTEVTGVTLQDPIDAIPDPVISATLDVFLNAREFAPFTVVSAREMNLIIAEERLANNDTGGFTTHVNNVRGLNSALTDYSGQIPATDMLIHERRVNLFLQGRRLADHYRFGIPSPEWLPQTPASTTPGTFFPIGITEIRSNPEI